MVASFSLISLAIVRLLEKMFFFHYLSYRIVLLTVLGFIVIIVTKRLNEKILSNLELVNITLSPSIILELVEDGKKKVNVLILIFLLFFLLVLFPELSS